MWLVQMALRNLLRHRSRTTISLLGIALSFAMVMTLSHFEYGAWQARLESSITAVSGHVVVQAPRYAQDPDPDLLVTDSSRAVAAIRAAVPEARVLRRAFVGGLLASPRNTHRILVTGVDPDLEADVTKLDDLLQGGDADRGTGAWLTAGDGSGVVLGRAAADALQVDVGDKVVFMTQAGDEMQSVPLRIRGIFRTGVQLTDGMMAMADLAAVQPLMVGPDPEHPALDPVHQIALHLPDNRHVDATRDAVEAALVRPDVAVQTWYQAQPELQRQMEVDRGTSQIIYVFIALIVGVVILSTILMSVLERTREFGVLLALGLRPVQLAELILLESLMLGVAGVLVGTLIHLGPTAYLMRYGFDYGDLISNSSDIAGVVLDSVMYARPDWGSFAFYVPLTIVLTVVASLWPAWRATRLHPVDAMRHV